MANGANLRVLVDANVLFAAVFSPRFPYEVLQHAIKGDCRLVLTEQIIHEARVAILKVIPENIATFDTLIIDTNYESLARISDSDIAANISIVRDSKDIHVALAAINSGVDMLVTSDKDFTDPNQPIQQRLTILLPGAFLRLHMGWTSEALEAIRTRTWADLDTKDG